MDARRSALNVLRGRQFRGRQRLQQVLGLNDPGLIPTDERWVDCIEGLRLTTSTPQDFMFRALYTDGYYQDDVLVALRNLLSPGMTFFDIGANYGFMSLYVDRMFQGSVTTVAFEPSPTVLPYLRENIAENEAVSVSVDDRCISDTNGSTSFFYSDENSWNATLIVDFASEHGETKVVDVEAVRLDDLVADGARPDVMKLDVEGAEHLVIRGGQEYLRSAHPAIVAEYNLKGIEGAGLTGDEYLELFWSLGYSVSLMPRPVFGWHRWNDRRVVSSASELPHLCNLVVTEAK